MITMRFDEGLNTKTMSKYFESVIKKADYSDDVSVHFEPGAEMDLSGLQVLYAIKKELTRNGKLFIVDGLPDLFIEYLNK